MNLKIFVAIALASVFFGLPAAAQDTPAPSYQGLSPGDDIMIQVWRKPELSCECVVAGNGTVVHPLYREVSVAGVPLSVVEERLRTFLSRYEQNPQFVIQPMVRIIVGGEIRSPNIYKVPPETTIAQAVAAAGGPTERGRLDRLRIIRDRQEIMVDLSRPDSDAALLQIRSGDQILIGRRGINPLTIIGPVASTIGAAAAIVGIFTR